MVFLSKSKQPRKQRKSRYNAPLHIKQKLMRSMLDKSLRNEYKKRTVSVIKGDTVKIISGDHKGKSGLVINVNLKRNIIFINGITTIKANGSEALISISPSNVIITKLELKDKTREERIRRK